MGKGVDMSTRRVVAILGAGGALGGAISARLASEADTDLVLSDMSKDSLGSTLGALAGAAGSVETMVADVTVQADVDAVVARAVERFGRLDVVIGNAGVLSPNGRIHNLDDEDWDRAFRVNVMGSVHVVKSAVGAMRSNGGGSIVLTASVAGMTAWSHAGPYCVTKAGIIELAKVAAVEYAKDRIRVNCVCPGTFRSAIHEGLPDEALDAIAVKHPLGLGSAGDVAGAYAYLASDASRWTTGSAIVVDGGYTAP